MESKQRFSLLSLVIAKEQKTSEFRQAWIDALREDIALYYARVSIVQAYLGIAESLNAAKLLEDNSGHYIEMNQASLRIKLRLNSTECDSQAILEQMKSIEIRLNSDFADIRKTSSEISTALRKLEADAPRLLKNEWKRGQTRRTHISAC